MRDTDPWLTRSADGRKVVDLCMATFSSWCSRPREWAKASASDGTPCDHDSVLPTRGTYPAFAVATSQARVRLTRPVGHHRSLGRVSKS